MTLKKLKKNVVCAFKTFKKGVQNAICALPWIKERIREEIIQVTGLDPLTGALSREGFWKAVSPFAPLTEGWERRGTGNVSVCIIFIDLDNFKQLNDIYGHPRGDTALHMTSELLKDHIRATDVVCRWSGDEFVLALIDKATEKDAEKVMEKIEQKFTEMIAVMYPEAGAGLSYGIVSLSETPMPLLSAIEVADRKMYEQKNKKK